MAYDERVELVEWDERWPEAYEAEGIRVLEALGESVRAIEHVGSTAVEGLLARPIVDIMVGVDSLEAATPHVVTLQELGYEYLGEAGLEGRRFFRKRAPEPFNLELLIYRGAPWRGRLAFREYLRDHPDEAESYARQKREILEEAESDALEAYNRAKRPLLDDWTETAADWWEERGVS